MGQVKEDSHIEIRSGVRGERAFILGHRVRVQDVVLWSEEGLTADEIVSRVPTLSLSEVHGALAYYYDHRAEIDRQIREDCEFAHEMERPDLPGRRHQA